MAKHRPGNNCRNLQWILLKIPMGRILHKIHYDFKLPHDANAFRLISPTQKFSLDKAFVASVLYTYCDDFGLFSAEDQTTT